METKNIDWERLENDYIAGNFTTKAAMAKHYGCSPTAINKKAKKDGWPEYEPSSGVLAEVLIKKLTKPHEKILGSIAMRKIEELKKELGDNYSHVDEPLIVCYAKAYERYIELEVQMSLQEVVSTSTKGGKYLNPLFNAIQMTQKTLVTIGGQLGLSIYSRKRMGMKLGEENDKGGGLFDFADDINKLVGTVNA